MSKNVHPSRRQKKTFKEACSRHPDRSVKTCVECDRNKFVKIWRKSAVESDRRRFLRRLRPCDRPSQARLYQLLRTAVFCCYCNKDLAFCNDPTNPMRASLDRIDSEFPHRDDNLVICCRRCNSTKGRQYWVPFGQALEPFTE